MALNYHDLRDGFCAWGVLKLLPKDVKGQLAYVREKISKGDNWYKRVDDLDALRCYYCKNAYVGSDSMDGRPYVECYKGLRPDEEGYRICIDFLPRENV